MRFLSLVFILLLSACASTSNQTVAEQRQQILAMKQQVLQQLYRNNPNIKKQVNNAAGYAVFSNAQLNLFFIAGGGGYGVAHNNNSGKNTYMNMGEAGVGLGLGVKDFRVLFIFHSNQAYNKFINDGWTVGAEADAAAKSSDKGDATSAGAALGDISVYQITESGLALQAMVKGTKYWRKDELN